MKVSKRMKSKADYVPYLGAHWWKQMVRLKVSHVQVGEVVEVEAGSGSMDAKVVSAAKKGAPAHPKQYSWLFPVLLLPP